MAEPYFTWQDAAAIVKGEKRLKELLQPSTDTAEDHPTFDEAYGTAIDTAEAEFERAGFAVPLNTPLTDNALRNAIIGLFLGIVTETSSDREPWIENLAASSKKYLERIGKGELSIKGVIVEEDASEIGAGPIGGRFPRRLMFDREDEDSEINDVFPPLGGFVR